MHQPNSTLVVFFPGNSKSDQIIFLIVSQKIAHQYHSLPVAFPETFPAVLAKFVATKSLGCASAIIQSEGIKVAAHVGDHRSHYLFRP